ncbi:MAG: alpha/beta fold hydrolase [Actinomycetota bacterium]
MSVRRVLIGAATTGVAAWAFPRVVAGRVRRTPDDDPDTVLGPPAGEERTVATHDGGALRVIEAGDPTAPPIVLAHGVTLSNRVWVRQLAALPERGFRVVAYEHRGHGGSSVGVDGHSVGNLARDLRGVLEALDLRDAVVVGHSMGGVAAQAFAIEFPDVAAARVRGIVLLSSLAYTPFGSRTTQVKERLGTLADRLPDSRRVWESPDLGLALARIGFGHRPRPSHVELVRQMMVDCAPATRRDAPAQLVGLDLLAGLPEFPVPALVICGTADVITPPSESRRMANLIPGARLELLRGGGHMLMLERADVVDDLVGAFAHEVGAAPRAAA